MKERNDCEPHDPSHCSGGLAFPRDISVLTDILPYDLKLKSAATRSFLIFFFQLVYNQCFSVASGGNESTNLHTPSRLGKKKTNQKLFLFGSMNRHLESSFKFQEALLAR